jgi:hypothetical protein
MRLDGVSRRGGTGGEDFQMFYVLGSGSVDVGEVVYSQAFHG